MKSIYLLLFIGFSISLTSCTSEDNTDAKAEQTVNDFLSLIVQQNPDKAAKLLDSDSFDVPNASEQLRPLCKNDTDGKMVSFKKELTFKTNRSNEVTVARLRYVLVYESTSYHRIVTIIDRGDGFRITSIE